MKRSLLVLSGPNLNLLGTREPGIYGADTLDDVIATAASHAAGRGIELHHRQSNHEGELIDEIQAAVTRHDGAIINLGGYTHSSVAIRDALLATGLPFIEVHLSNLYRREEFRHHSVTADIALGVIAGFGADGYLIAVDQFARRFGDV